MKTKLLIAVLLVLALGAVFIGCNEAVSLSFKEERIVVGVGKEITPEISVRPKNAEYSLSVSNTTIAEANGKTVKGLKTGITDLTVTSGGKSAKTTLIVSDADDPNKIDYEKKAVFCATFHIVNPTEVGLLSSTLESRYFIENDVISVALPSYAGYTVDGWFTDPQCTVRFVTLRNPTKNDIDLYCRATAMENSFLMNNDGMVSGLLYKNLPHETLELPYSINGTVIKGVASNAFAGDLLLKKVIIPASYEKISDFAFAGCTKLETVEIEEGSRLSSIGKFAFGISAKKDEAGSELVSGNDPCAKLRSINLPDTVSEIGAFAFGYCSSLDLRGVPSSLEKISYGAFCDTKISDVNLENVKEIQAFAFLGCSSLLTVRNTENIVSCGVDAFKNTALYNAQIDVSPYVVYAGTIAVECNDSYGKIVGGKLALNGNVTLIADGAFNGNNQSELTVYFPKGGIIIGDDAFIASDGVCLAVNDEATRDEYKEAVIKSDNAAYAYLFCIKTVIRIDDDENGVNYGEHTLLKFSDDEYYYDKFTTINSQSNPNTLKSPTKIDLSLLPNAQNIVRINTRAINFGEYGGNLEILLLPKNLRKIALLAVTNCGKLAEIDLSACFSVPEIVQNSFQFTFLGHKTDPKTETKISVKSGNLGAYKSKWEGKGVAVERLTAKQ